MEWIEIVGNSLKNKIKIILTDEQIDSLIDGLIKIPKYIPTWIYITCLICIALTVVIQMYLNVSSDSLWLIIYD